VDMRKARAIMRVFSATKRKPHRYALFLRRRYPRVVGFMLDEVRRGRCPLCGLQLKATGVGLAFASHLKRRDCKGAWFAVIKAMVEDRLPEEEVVRVLNGVRMGFGLPPAHI